MLGYISFITFQFRNIWRVGDFVSRPEVITLRLLIGICHVLIILGYILFCYVFKYRNLF